MLKKYILLLLLVIPFFCSNAQDTVAVKWGGFGIEAVPKGMSMIKHTKNFTGPISKFLYGLDLNFLQQTYGKKAWHERRNYPLLGFGLTYIDYNNSKIYGQVIGISPNITLPIWKTNRLEWTCRAGMGVGIATRHYNRTTSNNTTNVAIGGVVNNVSPFATDFRYLINPQWQLSIGGNFTHVSNATFQVPNLGINVWGGHIGIRYFPINAQPERIHHIPKYSFRNNYMGFVKTSIAFKEIGAPDGPTYRTYIAQAGVAKRYAHKNKLYMGVDFHYHTYKYLFELNSGATVDNRLRTAGQFAVFLGHEFIFGRVGVVGQIGYYVLPSYNQPEFLYQKLGGNFYFIRKEHGFLKELYCSAILKTHFTIAELFELGIGISF